MARREMRCSCERALCTGCACTVRNFFGQKPRAPRPPVRIAETLIPTTAGGPFGPGLPFYFDFRTATD
jgi:hypothetical protein